MEKFDHFIVEARPAIMDTDGFWQFHDWLADVVRLNDLVEAGVARTITRRGEGQAVVSFGGGFHYDVEYVTACHICGIDLTHYETDPDTRSCHPCRKDALDQEWALT